MSILLTVHSKSPNTTIDLSGPLARAAGNSKYNPSRSQAPRNRRSDSSSSNNPLSDFTGSSLSQHIDADTNVFRLTVSGKATISMRYDVAVSSGSSGELGVNFVDLCACGGANSTAEATSRFQSQGISTMQGRTRCAEVYSTPRSSGCDNASVPPRGIHRQGGAHGSDFRNGEAGSDFCVNDTEDVAEVSRLRSFRFPVAQGNSSAQSYSINHPQRFSAIQHGYTRVPNSTPNATRASTPVITATPSTSYITDMVSNVTANRGNDLSTNPLTTNLQVPRSERQERGCLRRRGRGRQFRSHADVDLSSSAALSKTRRGVSLEQQQGVNSTLDSACTFPEPRGYDWHTSAQARVGSYSSFNQAPLSDSEQAKPPFYPYSDNTHPYPEHQPASGASKVYPRFTLPLLAYWRSRCNKENIDPRGSQVDACIPSATGTPSSAYSTYYAYVEALPSCTTTKPVYEA